MTRNPLGRAAPAALRAGDLVMARRQLLDFKALAERDARRYRRAGRGAAAISLPTMSGGIGRARW